MKHFTGEIYESLPDGTYRSFTLTGGLLNGSYKEWHTNGRRKLSFLIKRARQCVRLKKWDVDGVLRVEYKDAKCIEYHPTGKFSRVCEIVTDATSKDIMSISTFDKDGVLIAQSSMPYMSSPQRIMTIEKGKIYSFDVVEKIIENIKNRKNL